MRKLQQVADAEVADQRRCTQQVLWMLLQLLSLCERLKRYLADYVSDASGYDIYDITDICITVYVILMYIFKIFISYYYQRAFETVTIKTKINGFLTLKETLKYCLKY